MTTTLQLQKWAKKKGITGFLGVFAADQLPEVKHSRIRQSLIVNYDPSDLPGSHWCGILMSPRTVTWFDSFGLPPDADDLILGHRTDFHLWLSQICQQFGLKRYQWNTIDLQDLAGDTCGLYALWFIKNGLDKGWKGFGKDTKANDLLIRSLILIKPELI